MLQLNYSSYLYYAVTSLTNDTHTGLTLCKKASIHQVTTMLATSKMSNFQVITTC